MALADRVPGLRPGATARNLVVLALYLSVAVAALTLLILLSPIILGIAVARDYKGTATRLARLPGITAEGGAVSGVAAIVYGVALFGIVGAVAPGGAPEDQPGDATTVETDTPTPEGDVDRSSQPVASDSETSDTAASGQATTSTASSAETADTSSESAAAETNTPPSSTTNTPTPTSTPTATSTPTPTPVPTTEAPAGPEEGTRWEVTITRVIDGDTIEARFPNGETDTLRLLGVDTPETTLSRVSPDEFERIPDTTAGRDHLYNWGERATEFATNELSGETVRVEVDPRADRRGSFGRLLVYVFVDGENFNKRLLDDGYARVYESSFSMRSEFESAEATAQANGVGLWDFDAPETTVAPDTPEDSGTDEVDLPPLPPDGDYNCGDFDTHEQAQYVLDNTPDDPHRLDADDDDVACESLKE